MHVKGERHTMVFVMARAPSHLLHWLDEGHGRGFVQTHGTNGNAYFTSTLNIFNAIPITDRMYIHTKIHIVYSYNFRTSFFEVKLL